ncbi:MAG: stage II sporulation protein M [Clostridiaceae bacterium]|nr:stage II sporulation protein M [Clostridiaceae bacterium]
MAYARTHYPGSQVEKYLNSIVGNAHHLLYTVRKNPWYDLKDFVLHSFPRKLLQYKLYILSSFIIFLLGALISFVMVAYDTSYSLYFIPPKILSSIDYSFEATQWDYPLMTSIIMINNITVSLKAFIYGIFLGIGTLYILFLNGGMLGALTALAYFNGDFLRYASLILPHGILELTAIFIAGGAGLLIGKAMLIPGKYARLDAVIKNTKEGVSLILGAVIFLGIAALIEGFFTPLPISPVIKLVFAFLTFICIVFYVKPLK